MAIVTYLSNAHALSSPCSETLALSPNLRIGPWRFDSAQRLDLLLAAARPGLHQVLLRFEGFARPCLLQHLFCLPKLTIALVATVSGFSQFFLILEHPRRSSIRASVIIFSHFPLSLVVASPYQPHSIPCSLLTLSNSSFRSSTLFPSPTIPSFIFSGWWYSTTR